MRDGVAVKSQKVNRLVKVSVLTAIALVLQMIDFPLPIFPEFLKMDLSDLPALLGALAMGPMAGVGIEALKNVLHTVIKPTTLGVGELANFVVGAAYVYAAGVIYMRKKDKTHALYGLILGSIAMTLVAAVGNLFVFLPLYESVLGFKITDIVAMGAAVNPSITDVNTFIVLSIVPFNLLKAVLVSVIGLMSYKSLSPILHR